jgi:hypothetical protein
MPVDRHWRLPAGCTHMPQRARLVRRDLAATVARFGSQHRWHFVRHDLQASGAAPASSGGASR